MSTKQFSMTRQTEASSRPLWARLLPLLPLLVVGLLLSGVITWINLGWREDFFSRWMRAFAVALPVMPIGILLMARVGRQLALWWPDAPVVALRLLLALVTAVVMESLMATVVTLVNRGLTEAFAQQWSQAFVQSLPVGLWVGLTMAFVVRPWIERLQTLPVPISSRTTAPGRPTP